MPWGNGFVVHNPSGLCAHNFYVIQITTQMKEKLHSLQHCRAPLKEIEQALKDRKMTTGQLAFLALSSILQHPDFPESLIEKFQTYKFSNQVFGVCYPLLIRRRDWTKSAQYY